MKNLEDKFTEFLVKRTEAFTNIKIAKICQEKIILKVRGTIETLALLVYIFQFIAIVSRSLRNKVVYIFAYQNAFLNF